MRTTWGENLHMALAAVWSHGFRSLLTVAGIVVGISTVVTVSSLLSGLRKDVVGFFEALGPDNIFVYRTDADPTNPMAVPTQQRRRAIRPEYAEWIERACPSVQDTSVSLIVPPVMHNRPLTARVPGIEFSDLVLAGAASNHFTLAPRNLVAGRVFTADEDRRGARVAVLGFNVAGVLFPGRDAIGRRVTVDGAEYTIIGVFEKAQGGFFGENELDRTISLPLRTAQLRYPNLPERYLITAKAFPGRRDEAFEEVQDILRKIRRTPPGQPNDFSLTTPDQVMKQFDGISSMMILVSTAISGLGLLVGGIGVMNIMLVSVTERTREIGVRKAVGARRFDIVSQFLLEAITLTGAGGLAGIVLSVGAMFLIGSLVPSLPSGVPGWAVLAAFSLSVGVGLFFGVWPAMKAARLDPVEALRYE
jgi:putative ABC transport system permease protein